VAHRRGLRLGLDVALSAVLNAGRFDLGFYVGRTYGLLASGFVLLVLLIEANALYARLVAAHEKGMRRLDILRGHRSRDRRRRVAGRDCRRGDPAAARASGRAARRDQRLRLSLPASGVARRGRPQRVRTGPGVRYSLELMGDIDALRRGEAQVIDTHSLPPGPEVDALLKSGVHVYMAIPMIAGGDLIGAVSFGGELATFPAEQVDLAREVATQLAIAISQARLYTRIKQYSEELELRVYLRTSCSKPRTRSSRRSRIRCRTTCARRCAPSTGTRGCSRRTTAPSSTPEGMRILRAVRTNGQRMAQLIDDLLAFSGWAARPSARSRST
jgi:hypothetical protein